jgi:hypothetical protein
MFERFMLPLKFCKMFFDRHMIHRFVLSRAKACRTSDRGIPNSRAIRDGVMPALNADRTAFTWPRVNEFSAAFNFAAVVAGDFVKSGEAGKSVSALFGILPRRFSSSTVAVCIKSNSPSLKYLTAFRRFLGRTYRCGVVSVVAFGAGEAESVAVGNWSGASRSAGWRPMASACREQYRSAISIERKMVLPSPSALSCPQKSFRKQPLRLRARKKVFASNQFWIMKYSVNKSVW